VRVRQEQLLSHVEEGEGSCQLVSEAGLVDWRRGRVLLNLLWIDTGGAGLGARGREGQQTPQGGREAAEEPPGPVGVAEERTGGQHGVGKHSCQGSGFTVIRGNIDYL